MTKEEYLSALRREISALPYEEQEEAIQYYADYFDDSNNTDIEAIIAQLGSPKELGAALVAKFTCVPQTKKQSDKWYARDIEVHKKNTKEHNESNFDDRNILLIVILAIITIPIWLPVVLSGAGVVLTIAIIIVVISCLGVIIGGAIGIGGLVTTIVGIVLSITNGINGFLVLGIGCTLCGLGICVCLLGIWFSTKVIPAVVKFIQNLFYRNKDKQNQKTVAKRNV